MVPEIRFIIGWNLVKFLLGLCLLSVVMGIEFFVGLDVIAIEKWLADHPYALICSLSLCMIFINSFILSYRQSQQETQKRAQQPSQLFLAAIFMISIISVGYFGQSDFVYRFLLLGQLKLTQIVAIASLYYFDFNMLSQILRKSGQSALGIGIIVLSSALSTFVISLLFQEFRFYSMVFFVNSLSYAPLILSQQLKYSRTFYLLVSLLLSLITHFAVRSGVVIEYCIVLIFAFVLIQYLLRSFRRC